MKRQTLIALLAGLALPTLALAQANFAEGFENNGPIQIDGPANLVAQGWVFRNQSDPIEGSAWYTGDGFGGTPFEGAGYLASSSLATDFFGGAVSSWAILPDIAGLSAGDTVTLWIYGGGGFSLDSFFDVRYSPSGSDDTGSSPTDIGDFTDLLFTAELPIAELGYQRVTATVPGDGRLALRFHAPFLRSFAGEGAYLSVDSLTVGPAATDPCGIPIPNAGESVVWTAANSPFVVCQDLLIPVGAQVTIEAGAEVSFDPGTKLRVEGDLTAAGSALNPVRFSGSTSTNDGLEVGSDGQFNASFAEFSIHLQIGGANAAAVIDDSSFLAGSTVSGVPDIAVFERCEFTGSSDLGGFSGIAGTIRLVDSTFATGASANVAGLLYVDGITSSGAGLGFVSETVAHPVLLDNISVTGAPGPGITLTGPNFLLGENVTTQGNQYPVAFGFGGAGLLPGSSLPTSGNTSNLVRVDSFNLGPSRQWADTGIPYLVQGGFPQIHGGSLTVEPGANIKFGPGAGAFLVGSANLILKGTRENPIVLESQFSGPNRWFGLKWVDDFDAKARHTIFDGGEITVQSDGGVMDLINCTVQDSVEGTASVTGGIVNLLSSKIINNQVGMITTTSGRIQADGSISPSIFEGNAVAIDYNNNNTTPFLRFNWWGDATGPTSPLNPGGLGDVVEDVHPAAFTPFLATPPAQTDDHPVVNMEPTYWFANAGDKIILRWSSSDDQGVAAHRIEFADHDFPSEFLTIATLPADATTYEFTAPIILPNNLYPTPSAIRIVAIDSAGQESWDKASLRIPYQEDWTVVPQSVGVPGAVVHPNDRVDVCWSPSGFADAWVLMDGIGLNRSAGGTTTGCLPIGAGMPYSSTDTARIVVITTFGAGGRLNYSFSDYFSIRPDARFGDTPPQVDVSSPSASQQHQGGATIPVRWTASDDVDLRTFNIQASYDGGRAWHSVASDLPGSARAFDWRLPPSTGIADVRVRVVATDHRFQDSSSTTDPFEILAGDAPDCPADFAEPFGQLDFSDVVAFLTAFDAMDASADLALPLGQFDFSDVVAFLAAFGAGCP